MLIHIKSLQRENYEFGELQFTKMSPLLLKSELKELKKRIEEGDGDKDIVIYDIIPLSEGECVLVWSTFRPKSRDSKPTDELLLELQSLPTAYKHAEEADKEAIRARISDILSEIQHRFRILAEIQGRDLQ